jgi:hypothetical protein
MRFERDIEGGRAFMEFERRGGRIEVKSRGFTARYKSRGFQFCQQWQATESPLIHDGGQSVLSTGFDFRNSTITGSTLQGPNGSGQFLAVTFSTGRTLQPMTSTMSNLSTTQAFYGICQNKPRAGDAVDVGIFGITKAVSGSTAIAGGTLLQISATASGVLVPYTSTNGRPVALAIENATAVGQVFTAFIGGQQAVASALST